MLSVEADETKRSYSPNGGHFGITKNKKNKKKCCWEHSCVPVQSVSGFYALEVDLLSPEFPTLLDSTKIFSKSYQCTLSISYIFLLKCMLYCL